MPAAVGVGFGAMVLACVSGGGSYSRCLGVGRVEAPGPRLVLAVPDAHDGDSRGRGREPRDARRHHAVHDRTVAGVPPVVSRVVVGVGLGALRRRGAPRAGLARPCAASGPPRAPSADALAAPRGVRLPDRSATSPDRPVRTYNSRSRGHSTMVNLNVNGTARSFDGDDDMPLLWYLRDDLRLTGTRFGCGAGLCGACTVHVDGQAVRACQTPDAHGAEQARHDHRGAERRRQPPAAARLGGGQRPAVRLLPDRADHAGGGAAEPHAEPDRPGHRPHDGRQHLPLRHLSAHSRGHQAGRRRARRRGHEPHRKRQPPPVPRGPVLDRRLRDRRAGAARERLGAGPGRAHARPVGAARAQRLPGRRARRHGVHRHPPVRDGHRHPHLAAARRGRRARGRLEPRPHRAGARAIRSTATRTPTGRARSATSTRRSAAPARPRA